MLMMSCTGRTDVVMAVAVANFSRCQLQQGDLHPRIGGALQAPSYSASNDEMVTVGLSTT